MKRHNRTCEGCEAILSNTHSYAVLCLKCERIRRTEKQSQIDRDFLEFLYIGVEGPSEPNKHGKREWTFTHEECGCRQTWIVGNVRSRLKADPNHVPCKKCGAERRIGHAMKVYLEVHARTYDLAVYEDYARKCRNESEKTYLLFRHILNPHNHPRMLGNVGHHLDHRVPIRICFDFSIDPRIVGSLQNLEIIEAKANLSKGKHHWDATLLETLKACNTPIENT